MEIASTVAMRSHDAQTQVGALLVNNKSQAILATGFNGFIKGAKDAELPNTRPEKYEYILHAEENLLTNCGRHGISMDDCYLICTLSPCKHCMRLMINSGITKVVTKALYSDFQEILKMRDVQVDCRMNEDGFYEITYAPNT